MPREGKTSTSPKPAPSGNSLPDLASVVNTPKKPAQTGADEVTLAQAVGLKEVNQSKAKSDLAQAPKTRGGLFRWLVLVLVLVLAAGLVWYLVKNRKLGSLNAASQAAVVGAFSNSQTPLNDIAKQGGLSVANPSKTAKLTVNGQINVNGSLVVSATNQLNGFSKGQIYFDKTSGKLYFYNGQQSLDLTAQPTKGVTSVQGLSGAVNLAGGNGIAVTGATISNTGVLSLTAVDPMITVTGDGQGHYAIGSNIASSTVILQQDSPGVQQIGNINISGDMIAASFSGDGSALTSLNASQLTSGTVDDARLSTNVTLAGNTFNGANQLVKLNPSGDLPALSAINLTNLDVSNATAGTLNDLRLSHNVTLQGNTFNGASQLVQLTALGYLPILNGSNLTSLNASQLTSGTVDDSRLSGNVALHDGNNSFSGTNIFTNGISVNSITPTSGLTVGASGQNLTLQGNGSTTLASTSGGHTTTVGFSGSSTGDLNYNFDNSTAPGTYTICTTVGNCAGTGGGVTSAGGTTGALSRFVGGQAIGDSAVSDDGTTVTVQQASDSLNSFQIQNADGTSNLLVADTTNTRIGIGTAAPHYTLDVNGDINSASGLRVGGNLVCDSTGCKASSSSGFYIQNGTNLQTSANFNIQSAAANKVGGIIKGADGQTADLFQLQQGSTVVAQVNPGGDLNIVGNYKVNGSQIASANLSDGNNLAKLNADQTFTGNNTFTGLLVQQSSALPAFQIQDATGTSNLFVADTLDTRIGIGTATPGYTLDVNGDINIAAGGSYRINGVAICGSSATCAPSSGSSFYIQNSAALQANANFNIQSVNATAVGGIIRGASGQTADLFRLQDGDGANVFTVGPNGLTAIAGPLMANNGLTVTGVANLATLNVSGTTTTASLHVTGATTMDSTLSVAGNITVGANSSLVVTGGTSFPSSPVAGQVYYRSDTSQLYTYTGSKWQADRSSATEIVAASNTQNKEKADFVGDGSNDQNAINAAIAALPSSGGSVVLLDGTYNITATISVNKANVALSGQGTSTVLKRMYDGGANDGVITLMADSISIQNLKIDGNKANYSSANNNGVIGSSARKSVVISGNTIINLSGKGIVAGWNILGGANYGTWTIDNNIISSNSVAGISMTRVATTATNNTISANGGTGITNSECDHIGSPFADVYGSIFDSNNISGNLGSGLSVACTASISANNITFNGSVGVYLNGRDSTFTGNTVSHNASTGIAAYGSASSMIASNQVISNGGNGMELRGSTVAKANYVASNSGWGIALSSSTPAAGAAVIANSLINNSGGIQVRNRLSPTISSNNIVQPSGTAIRIDGGVDAATLSSNTLSRGLIIDDQASNTIYSNQQDSNGNLLNTGQAAGIGLNVLNPTASLQNAGAFVQGGLSSPGAPAVAVNGAAGSTTWGYKITASDGLGETLASTETQVTTGSATLNSTNYNQIVPQRVSGAVSYKVYRTTTGGSPSSTGLIGTIAGGAANFYLNDTGLAASGALPTADTTGSMSISGSLAVGTASATNKITVNTATTADSLAQVLVATGEASNKGLVIQGAAGQTANLQEWQGSDGTVLAYVGSDGRFTAPMYKLDSKGTYLSSGGLRTNADLSLYSTGQRILVSGASTAISGQSNSTGLPTMSVRGFSGQAVDLQQWMDGSGIVLASMGATGDLSVQGFAINTATTVDPTAQALIATGGNTNKGLVVQGAVGQTADLLQLQDSSGSVLAKFKSNGALDLSGAGSGSILTTAGGHVISNGSAGNTMNMLTISGLVRINDLRSPTISPYYGPSIVALTVKGQDGQTGNLQQWVNYYGTVLAYVDAGGSLSVKSATVNGTLTVTSAATFQDTLTVTGNATFNGDVLSLSSNVRGYNVAVPSGDSTLTITFGTAYPDANYAAFCTPNYNTTCFVTGKSTTGFTINLGLPAGSGNTVDWIVTH